MKTFKAWGKPYGAGKEITVEVKAKNRKEAKEKLQNNGIVLTSKIYN